LDNTNVKKLFESKADNRVGPINDFLKSKGFSIKLKDQGEGFYVASVFKQAVKWENPGTAGKLKLDSNKEVDAVMGMKNIDRYDYNGNKIYSLKTTDGTEVYMMPDK
jgi:hypothetical protein